MVKENLNRHINAVLLMQQLGYFNKIEGGDAQIEKMASGAIEEMRSTDVSAAAR